MFLACGEKTSASSGRWVLMKRRWRCASNPPSTWSSGNRRMSSHGESLRGARLAGASMTSWPTICCIQVVPDLPQVTMTMSSFLNSKAFQRVESKIAVWCSRFLLGHVMSLSAIAECAPYGRSNGHGVENVVARGCGDDASQVNPGGREEWFVLRPSPLTPAGHGEHDDVERL